MTGVIALQGGGPFTANDDLDARLLAEVAGIGDGRTVVLPTADAFEHPERLVTAALGWAERLEVEVEALMVLRRAEALDEGAAGVVRGARAVYLVGDQPLHLRSVLKDTPVWHAIGEVFAAGGLVVGVGACASALCDPMVDPRGGAFTLGLGLVPGLAVVHSVEQWSAERLQRTLRMADTTVASLPTGAALVRRGAAWESVGEVALHGELP
ncbi:MAG: Type 1 glutamine amidotransferase-like domain-containing protein [Acidimicrobiales bacterium]